MNRFQEVFSADLFSLLILHYVYRYQYVIGGDGLESDSGNPAMMAVVIWYPQSASHALSSLPS